RLAFAPPVLPALPGAEPPPPPLQATAVAAARASADSRRFMLLSFRPLPGNRVRSAGSILPTAMERSIAVGCWRGRVRKSSSLKRNIFRGRECHSLGGYGRCDNASTL